MDSRRQAPREAPARLPGRAGVRGRLAYAFMAAVLLAYLISLIVRDPSQSSTLVDGWLVASFELTAGGLCLARGPRTPGARTVPLILGCALVSWSIGDFVLTAETLGDATRQSP